MQRISGMVILGLIGWLQCQALAEESSLKIACFDVDASPRIGSPLAYDPCEGIQLPLACRGVVFLVEPQPIVVCAVDWIGIANEAHDAFRQSLASAAGTTPDRVAVHTLHQHDAPRIDLTADRLMANHAINHHVFDVPGFRNLLDRVQAAVKKSVQKPIRATHVAWAQGEVEKVASNRRILDGDGKVKVTRWTATSDPAIRAYPAGTIDPNLKLIAFYNGERPLVALTYYATHPQSYYRTGLANPDFPGMARNQRQEATGVFHVHFNGAGGNIGAGKWNDGRHAQRQILADRMAKGMEAAWDQLQKQPLKPDHIEWQSVDAKLPPAQHLSEESLVRILGDNGEKIEARLSAASHLAWLRRCKSGHAVEIGCLALGPVRILHLPGELFVEYQLAAQKLRPDLFVAMAAYGDYGPGYIGTQVAYGQGGYETSARASRVSAEVESTLMNAIQKLLAVDK
ncbi:MAG: hypothetical protein VYC98_17170 [Planctomycetota bacterium]|jgi:hypothetical protein|nr:hypothetical protein [Planctomycetota bacterium]MEC7978833.1 hypothetical protein [Planctomycetota bacterium]MEE3076589.1 hypothetical protein [Planctomycetota bacterium]